MPRREALLSPRIAAIALCLAAAAWLGAAWLQETRLARADEALRDGRAQIALRLTDDVTGSPRAARASRIAALAHLRLGEVAEAERALARAVSLLPQDWSLHFDRAVLLRRLGRDRQAARAMGQALALNPRAQLPVGFRPR